MHTWQTLIPSLYRDSSQLCYKERLSFSWMKASTNWGKVSCSSNSDLSSWKTNNSTKSMRIVWNKQLWKFIVIEFLVTFFHFLISKAIISLDLFLVVLHLLIICLRYWAPPFSMPTSSHSSLGMLQNCLWATFFHSSRFAPASWSWAVPFLAFHLYFPEIDPIDVS